MTRYILLDAGPLGKVTHPKEATNAPVAQWVEDRLLGGWEIRVPEVADYEIRRELLRARSEVGVQRLTEFGEAVGYLALTTADMRRAAHNWAIARQRGRPPAPDLALDADAILAAQAASLAETTGARVVVATENVGHLEFFIEAKHWKDLA